jgi:hypothetical protein
MSKHLCVLTIALLLGGPALADEAPPATPTGPGNWCQDNPEQCQKFKQRAQEKCAEDPARCEKFKADAAKRREECRANPEACKDKRAQWRERREERRALRQGQSQ